MLCIHSGFFPHGEPFFQFSGFFTLHGVFPWSVLGHRRPKSVVVFVHVVILAMLYHTSYISVFVSNQMSKQVCCIMVILTELGGCLDTMCWMSVANWGTLGQDQKKWRRFFPCSLFSELSRVFMWRRSQPTAWGKELRLHKHTRPVCGMHEPIW